MISVSNFFSRASQDVRGPAEPRSSSSTTDFPLKHEKGLNGSDAPRVDEALNSVLDHRNDPYVEPQENLSALRDEVDSLWYRGSDRLREQIRRKPLQAIGMAAFTGFLLGITR